MHSILGLAEFARDKRFYRPYDGQFDVAVYVRRYAKARDDAWRMHQMSGCSCTEILYVQGKALVFVI